MSGAIKIGEKFKVLFVAHFFFGQWMSCLMTAIYMHRPSHGQCNLIASFFVWLWLYRHSIDVFQDFFGKLRSEHLTMSNRLSNKQRWIEVLSWKCRFFVVASQERRLEFLEKVLQRCSNRPKDTNISYLARQRSLISHIAQAEDLWVILFAPLFSRFRWKCGLKRQTNASCFGWSNLKP